MAKPYLAKINIPWFVKEQMLLSITILLFLALLFRSKKLRVDIAQNSTQKNEKKVIRILSNN